VAKTTKLNHHRLMRKTTTIDFLKAAKFGGPKSWLLSPASRIRLRARDAPQLEETIEPDVWLSYLKRKARQWSSEDPLPFLSSLRLNNLRYDVYPEISLIRTVGNQNLGHARLPFGASH
jgi:hypothetical protein